MTPPIHLAKSPHAAVLVSWCGQEERRTRKPTPVMGPFFARVDRIRLRARAEAALADMQAKRDAYREALESVDPDGCEDLDDMGGFDGNT